MKALLGMVWRAVRPVGAFQRSVWWAGTLLVFSGAAHLVVAAVDGGSWWGPVSWRKPVAFGFSMGLLFWSLVWILRQAPQRWWVRVPAGIVAFCGTVEVGLITMQRWRGVASHFNDTTPVDAGIWSAIGTLILPLTLGVAWLTVAVLARFPGSIASRIAAVTGLAAVLAAGAIGKDMAAIGEAAFDATGQVPADILFGAAGSAKLAHAVGLHGIQILALLAIGLDAGRLRPRQGGLAMLAAALGFAAVFGAVAATAYAGRAPYAPTVAMSLLLVGGAIAVATVAVTAFALLPGRRTGTAEASAPAPLRASVRIGTGWAGR
ncbi:hypothetical protein Val02_49070 [Virgisporangium aliadipatigenens]|uniref:Uncharacterized protein n=1 Tax=Virgisporangium aliadipatigenens TaxID=741659 RepID=A0A8J3YQH2_9ACTN|nr:hypothetical protein [Virgisporangium aliadipatigenens]GIJ48021.1 hypothetical protein Val02_49070 [Virgisporangium aliadipatigenens]